jgi:hypothetical protein
VIRLKERVGFAHAAYGGLLEVRTECVAVEQHDLAFVRGVDLGALCIPFHGMTLWPLIQAFHCKLSPCS